MRFEWHEAKRPKTLDERGIDFAFMNLCFDDPDRLVRPDKRRDYGELCFNILGLVRGRLFHVTFTLRGETIWIISARKANPREQKLYGSR